MLFTSFETLGMVCECVLMGAQKPNTKVLLDVPLGNHLAHSGNIRVHNSLMWIKQCHKPSPSHHHFHGWYMCTIPSHGWFMTLFDPHWTRYIQIFHRYSTRYSIDISCPYPINVGHPLLIHQLPFLTMNHSQSHYSVAWAFSMPPWIHAPRDWHGNLGPASRAVLVPSPPRGHKDYCGLIGKIMEHDG